MLSQECLLGLSTDNFVVSEVAMLWREAREFLVPAPAVAEIVSQAPRLPLLIALSRIAVTVVEDVIQVSEYTT